MVKKTFRFSSSSVDYYFDGGFSLLKDVVKPAEAVLLVDVSVCIVSIFLWLFLLFTKSLKSKRDKEFASSFSPSSLA